MAVAVAEYGFQTRWRYEWVNGSGVVSGVVEADTEPEARAVIRAQHGLKYVPDGATVLRDVTHEQGVNMPPEHDAASLKVIGSQMTAKAIGLSLHRGRFEPKRKASTSKIQVDKTAEGTEADKALLGLNKTILVSPEMKIINSIDGELDTWLKTHTLIRPLAYNIAGVPLELVQPVESTLRQFAARRAKAADDAAAMYLTRVAETRARLGVMDDEPYPTVEAFRSRFYMRWDWLMFETPESLSLISVDLFESERAKVAKQLQQVALECEQAMRVGLQSLVDNLMVSLTPGPDGKLPRFHPSVVKHLSEFLSTFDARNVTDDALLAPLASKAKAILNGVDPALLLTDAASRPALAAKFAEIQSALVPLASPRRRMISFEDAPEPDGFVDGVE